MTFVTFYMTSFTLPNLSLEPVVTSEVKAPMTRSRTQQHPDAVAANTHSNSAAPPLPSGSKPTRKAKTPAIMKAPANIKRVEPTLKRKPKGAATLPKLVIPGGKANRVVRLEDPPAHVDVEMKTSGIFHLPLHAIYLPSPFLQLLTRRLDNTCLAFLFLIAFLLSPTKKSNKSHFLFLIALDSLLGRHKHI